MYEINVLHVTGLIKRLHTVPHTEIKVPCT